MSRRPARTTPLRSLSRPFRSVAAGVAAMGTLLFAAACRRESPVAPEAVPPPPAESRSASDSPQAAAELAPGTSRLGELAGGRHIYRLRLGAGESADIVVDQQGVDVVSRLVDSAGTLLLEVDSFSGPRGPEEVFWWTEDAADLRLEISSWNAGAAGRYELAVRHLGPAREGDRERAAATRQFDAAERRRRHGDLDAATALYEQALAAWRRLGDVARQAEAHYRLGLVHARQRARREAIGSYEEAGRLFARAGEPRMQASALHQIGRLCYALGEIETARERYEEALRLRRELGDARGEAFSYNNLGLTSVVLGELQEALTYYDEALKRWRQAGDREQEGVTLQNRGKCYLYLGRFQQALDDLERALEVREELGDRHDQAVTLTGIGLVHEARALYPAPDARPAEATPEETRESLREALRFLERALAIDDADDPSNRAATLSIMGRIFTRLGDDRQALEKFDQALAIFRQLGNRHRAAMVLHYVGVLQYSLDQYGQALVSLRQALPLLAATERQNAIDALATIARAERKLGHLEASREAIVQALDKNEALRIKPASRALRSSLFALRQDFYDFYVDLLIELDRRHPGAGYDARALEASERARARSQLEALIESGVDLTRGGDPELRRRAAALEGEIHDLELRRLRLLDEAERTDQLTALESELRSLLREYEQAQGRIRLASPSYAALIRPSPLGVEEIRRRALGDDTLLLQYDLGEKRSYLWALTRQSISTFELPGRRAIEPLARRAYELLTLSHRRESRLPTRQALAELSDILLRPVAPMLGRRRLLIVGEGALHYVPFGALPLAGDAPLLAGREVVYAPSASTLAELRRRRTARPPAPGTIAVVADPVFQSHDPRFSHDQAAAIAAGGARGGAADLRRFERLVYSEQEAAAIAALVDAGDRFEALGFAADRDVVASGVLGRYRIVHFATHGYVDAEHPELSRLVLSLLDERGRRRDDGFLFAHEIYDLELPAELVVLSACRTALGREVRGEGLVGLTQAFMYAGASRVLVSLWPVNDEATAELMARFYRHLLLDGLSPAAALARAQLSISREARWQAPYYWAGFVLQGEW